MRLRFDCAMATTLPRVIVSAASTHSTAVQSAWTARTPERSSRTSTANTAAFDPVAMSAVTLVGAPS